MSEQIAQTPIRLSFESVQQVIVTPDNRDRFVTTAGEAARACKSMEDSKEWQGNFREFLGYLNAKCREFGSELVACYVAVGEEGLRVFMTTPGEDYQPALDDRITAIDIELSQRFPMCPADCVQIPSEPADSLNSFFSLEHSFQVYGDRNHSPRKSRAQSSIP